MFRPRLARRPMLRPPTRPMGVCARACLHRRRRRGSRGAGGNGRRGAVASAGRRGACGRRCGARPVGLAGSLRVPESFCAPGCQRAPGPLCVGRRRPAALGRLPRVSVLPTGIDCVRSSSPGGRIRHHAGACVRLVRYAVATRRLAHRARRVRRRRVGTTGGILPQGIGKIALRTVDGLPARARVRPLLRRPDPREPARVGDVVRLPGVVRLCRGSPAQSHAVCRRRQDERHHRLARLRLCRHGDTSRHLARRRAGVLARAVLPGRLSAYSGPARRLLARRRRLHRDAGGARALLPRVLAHAHHRAECRGGGAARAGPRCRLRPRHRVRLRPARRRDRGGLRVPRLRRGRHLDARPRGRRLPLCAFDPARPAVSQTRGTACRRRRGRRRRRGCGRPEVRRAFRFRLRHAQAVCRARPHRRRALRPVAPRGGGRQPRPERARLARHRRGARPDRQHRAHLQEERLQEAGRPFEAGDRRAAQPCRGRLYRGRPRCGRGRPAGRVGPLLEPLQSPVEPPTAAVRALLGQPPLSTLPPKGGPAGGPHTCLGHDSAPLFVDDEPCTADAGARAAMRSRAEASRPKAGRQTR